ncbi:MAG: signal recognition particle protein Srp19 [Desulfurococcales archaeon]|nr:signal recognition particle protein Srp19 [Desulfurococcales archaeon]
MSKEYRGERIVLYPAYLDKRLPRRLGRRVPRDLAVLSPRLEEIAAAAEELGLDPIIEEDKAYPRAWFRSKGRVIVLRKYSKQETLRMIASRIVELRRRKKRPV